jgi:hypothetical protein
VVKAGAPSDATPHWRGTCAICLELLPIAVERRVLYACCCKKICVVCAHKCDERDTRCPFCRAAACKSNAESMRRLQKHADKGHAEAQEELGSLFFFGRQGIEKNLKRAVEQGHHIAQCNLGSMFRRARLRCPAPRRGGTTARLPF